MTSFSALCDRATTMFIASDDRLHVDAIDHLCQRLGRPESAHALHHHMRAAHNVVVEDGYYVLGFSKKEPRKWVRLEWTPEKMALLAKRWNAGASLRTIAPEFDCSMQTIWNRVADLRKQGVPMRDHRVHNPITPSVVARVVAELAGRFFTTVDKVHSHCRKQDGRIAARKAIAVALHRLGMSWKAIGRTFNRNHTSAIYWATSCTDDQRIAAVAVADAIAQPAQEGVAA